jgi:flavin-dependent thymidylate synthase
MKVTLISHTPDAMDLLIFTKNTRLNMTTGTLDEIRSWNEERKLSEIKYIAQTNPGSHEFIEFVFAIEGVSRAFTHQFVRTRHGSYAQQSLRVVNKSDYDYVFTNRNLSNQAAVRLINQLNDQVKATYQLLLEEGQPVEDVRGILPTNIATNIVAKFNLRTLSELARSRTGGRSQGEYRDVMNAMIDEVLRVLPWADAFLVPKSRDLFKDIEEFAEAEFGGDLLRKGKLLKIVDALRKDLK